MKRDFQRVLAGMSMDDVEGVLGPPEESHATSFGAERMTTWAYRADGGRLFIWFDEDGRVKLKSNV